MHEQTAIKTFYLLIFGAATLRAIWFFIPSDALEPTYAPTSVKAFSTPVGAVALPLANHLPAAC